MMAVCLKQPELPFIRFKSTESLFSHLEAEELGIRISINRNL